MNTARELEIKQTIKDLQLLHHDLAEALSSDQTNEQLQYRLAECEEGLEYYHTHYPFWFATMEKKQCITPSTGT